MAASSAFFVQGLGVGSRERSAVSQDCTQIPVYITLIYQYIYDLFDILISLKSIFQTAPVSCTNKHIVYTYIISLDSVDIRKWVNYKTLFVTE